MALVRAFWLVHKVAEPVEPAEAAALAAPVVVVARS
jgi:hypothetical protein